MGSGEFAIKNFKVKRSEGFRAKGLDVKSFSVKVSEFSVSDVGFQIFLVLGYSVHVWDDKTRT